MDKYWMQCGTFYRLKDKRLEVYVHGRWIEATHREILEGLGQRHAKIAPCLAFQKHPVPRSVSHWGR